MHADNSILLSMTDFYQLDIEEKVGVARYSSREPVRSIS